MAAKKKNPSRKNILHLTVITLVVEEQLPHPCSAQGSRFVVIFSQSSAEPWRTATTKAGSSHFLAFVVVHVLKQNSPIDVPTVVFNGTCGLCSSNPFYYIYFQVEQPQLPNNDIKSAGIPAQGESMLTRVITETTCWGSNSFQISRCYSWCTDINLVACLKGCCLLLYHGDLVILVCLGFCWWWFGVFLIMLKY